MTWAERGLALVGERGPPQERLRPLGYRGTARCGLGNAEGLDDLRAALRMARDAGLTYQAGLWQANLANSLGDFDPVAGLAAFQEGAEFAERRGLTELAMWMRGGTLERLFDFGRWDELLAEAGAIVAWYRANAMESFIILSAEVQQVRVLAFRASSARRAGRAVPGVPTHLRDHLMTLTCRTGQGTAKPAAAVGLVEKFSGDQRPARVGPGPFLPTWSGYARRPASSPWPSAS